MDPKNFPTSLQTLDDYEKASVSFVLPFLQERALRVAEVLRELYAFVDKNKELDRETVDLFLNKIREAVSFAEETNPAFLYFKNVMELEKRLDEAGAFTTEEVTLETQSGN